MTGCLLVLAASEPPFLQAWTDVHLAILQQRSVAAPCSATFRKCLPVVKTDVAEPPRKSVPHLPACLEHWLQTRRAKDDDLKHVGGSGLLL